MDQVVFLRGANVGGKNVFRPAQFIKTLKGLDVVNIGAAGTFVVRDAPSPSALEKEFLKKLPFEPAISIRSAKEIFALVATDPFKGEKFVAHKRRGWAAALCGKPKRGAKLPIVAPATGKWSVRLDRVEGYFALGIWQLREKGFIFPANIVEDATGVESTVRWWETFLKIAAVLRSE